MREKVLKRLQRRTCLNCIHLRVLLSGDYTCDLGWFWNKFQKEHPNRMKQITLQKKGERYAGECRDFCNRWEKERENQTEPKRRVG